MRHLAVQTVLAISVFLLGNLAAPVNVAGQEAATSAIELSVRPTADGEDAALSGILFDLIAVELEWAGFTVRSAGSSGSDYHVITAEYETREKDMRFAFEWTDASGGRVYAEVERSVDVSLGMDFVIASAVRQLVSKAGVQALKPGDGSNAAAETETSRSPSSGPSASDPSRTSHEMAPADSSTGSARGPSAPGGSSGPAGRVSGPESVAAAPAEPVSTQAGERGRFLLDAGGGVFLTVGDSRRYFAVSPGGTLFMGFQIKSGWFAFGFAAVGTRFYAEGFALSSIGYCGGAGLGLRLSTGGGRGPYLQFSGGPAILAFDNERTGFVYGTMPYAGAAVGLPVRLSAAMSLTTSVEFSAFFSGAELLLGVTPTVELSVRL